MSDSSQQRKSEKLDRVVRRDPPEFDPASLWQALSMTPGVGVSIMDTEGALIFVNDTSQLLFFNQVGVDYRGKTVHDFHPPGFCRERIEMIRRVIAEKKPLVIKHIYYGRRIESTIWPINDKKPPFNRVVVISHNQASGPLAANAPSDFETIETRFIGLGPLDVLTQRELEVLVLLGNGMSVPSTAAMLHRSPNTVQRHKESISRKLSLSGQAELVSLVASMGLDLDDAHLQRYGD
ncbi:MAG: PAS domain-containing protein [Planctomycetales bacterium]|nr:PAS domain-containing protein [Planctomycetales bacterium]